MALHRIRELERKLSNVGYLVRSIARTLGIADCDDVIECLREVARRVEKLTAQTRTVTVQDVAVREEEISYLKLPSRPEVLERYYRKVLQLDETERKVLKAVLMGFALPESIRKATKLPDYEVREALRRLTSSEYRLVSFIRCVIKTVDGLKLETSINFPSVFLWAVCSYYPVLTVNGTQVTIPQYQAHVLRQKLENALSDRDLIEEVCRKLSGAGAVIRCREYSEDRCVLKLIGSEGTLEHFYPDIIAVVGDREWVIECHAFSYDIQNIVRKVATYILDRVNLWFVTNDRDLAVEQVLQRVAVAVFEMLRDREVRYSFRISRIGEFLNYREVAIVSTSQHFNSR